MKLKYISKYYHVEAVCAKSVSYDRLEANRVLLGYTLHFDFGITIRLAVIGIFVIASTTFMVCLPNAVPIG